MNSCISTQQIIILDCCFGGAFSKGFVPKGSSQSNFGFQLKGIGRVILTSSNEKQLSFAKQNSRLSPYTHYLIEGIQTGDADLNKDKNISVNEIHQYIMTRLKKVLSDSEPQIYLEQ